LLTTDYLIFALSALYVHLVLLILSTFSHGFIINDMHVDRTIPIPKGKNNVCKSAKFRGIALSAIISNIIDFVLLDLLSNYSVSSCLQFRFKKEHDDSQRNRGILYF
jgi:hypothetical protein